MTEPLTNQTIEVLAAGYVIGDLDPIEIATFEQLLAENIDLDNIDLDNTDLATLVNQLRVTLDRVVLDLNRVTPPAHLRSTLLAAAIAPPTAMPPTAKPQRSWRRNSLRVMTGAAAALMLYLGFENYQLRQNDKIAQEINTLLQQPQTQFFTLKAVNASDAAVGSFVVNLGQRQGILTAQNLATLPANQVYRVWAIADGEKIPCGTLNLNSQGKVVAKFWMPADFYDQGMTGVFVTIESSASSRYPTGPIVLQSMART